MKTLYIIRHWKSSWEWAALDDFDRPLNERGKGNIKLMWKKLREKKILPGIIISSPAKRAKKTAKVIAEKIWYKKDDIVYRKWIYDNHVLWIDYYLWLIMEIKNKYDEVFLVWHNFAWNELVNYLLGKDIWNIPTTWIVCIKFDIKSWDLITYSSWELDFFIYPKMFK